MARRSNVKIPKISVILPVYNGEDYLAEAINSILAQTFTDFELIIIDDGSSDDSLSIIQQYQKEDVRIKILSRENRGLVYTLNELINLAKGFWVARMDQDDISLPNRIERQLQWLAETDADICGTGIKLFDCNDDRFFHFPIGNDAIKMKLLFESPLAHPTVIMKTNLVRSLKYDPAYEKCEDYDLWERAAQKNWKMTNVPEVLLLYRKHESQISTVSSSIQHKLSQDIRRRYWFFLTSSLSLNQEGIEDILELTKSEVGKVDIDGANSLLRLLLATQAEEPREVIMNNIERLYIKAAGSNMFIAFQWYRLHRQFGSGLAVSATLKMLFLSVFHVRSNSFFFNVFKNIYFKVFR